MASFRWGPAARFGGGGLLLGLIVAGALGGGRVPEVRAQGTPAPAEAAGTIALTSNLPGGGQLLYLIDTRTQAFAVYRVDPQKSNSTVKLEAARQYRYDLKLAEYNNQPPDVASIEKMVGGNGRK